MLLQMIVGVLLFTPLLFLLPTTSVYYVLVLLLHTAVLMACWALQMSSRLLQRHPAYFLWCWAFKPGLVPGMLYQPINQSGFLCKLSHDQEDIRTCDQCLN